MASTAQAEDKENRLTVKEIKITKSLAIIAFSFALCWIPFWVIVSSRFFMELRCPKDVELKKKTAGTPLGMENQEDEGRNSVTNFELAN
ncbi:unnamed protein product [Pocillopora meandrina]|uniref:Uncharacterized protein n=1 Tax=Pocillopora meandrina TaxID=46732 RepID=A0AAU9VQS8_9CNID|nr:unnamed protein product [Pocillopora meandrina]